MQEKEAETKTDKDNKRKEKKEFCPRMQAKRQREGTKTKYSHWP